jgi:hypothetical protein
MPRAVHGPIVFGTGQWRARGWNPRQRPRAKSTGGGRQAVAGEQPLLAPRRTPPNPA